MSKIMMLKKLRAAFKPPVKSPAADWSGCLAGKKQMILKLGNH